MAATYVFYAGTDVRPPDEPCARPALERRSREVYLLGLGALRPRGSGLLAGSRHSFSDRRCYPLVEDAGYYVIFTHVFVGDYGGHGFGGGELHLLGYLAGADVEGAAEDAWEAEDVVDLVRVVAAAGGHDADLAVGYFGAYLGFGVRHGEDDGVLVHLFEVSDGEYARRREAQEQVRTLHGVGEHARPVLGVGVLGVPLLGSVETF